MSRKLILSNFQSPGDIVMLTAAVRDLHANCPGQFITDVRTSCPDLWLHNPWITPMAEHEHGAEVVSCHYPLIHQSNQLPFHFIHGFIQFLGESLGVRIQPTQFKVQGRHAPFRSGKGNASAMRSGNRWAAVLAGGSGRQI